jgi:adenylate cyclase
MNALARAGDRTAALQHARTHERTVQEQLDVAVEPMILEAATRIRQQPAGHAPASPVATGLSIAVLPFLDISPDHDNEYFSDGITEELTTLLARVPGLRVVSRTAAFVLKGRSLDTREVGEQLRVEAFVEGSVRKVGDRIRVTAQLVDAATGYQRWSETYDRKLENVFGLQEELSRAIVAALPLGTDRSAAVVVRPSTSVLEAYTLYLRGRFHSVRRTPESFKVAIEYFEQAVELDPDYALAHGALAECWMLLGFEEFGELPPMAAMPTAKAAAQRALELDERLAQLRREADRSDPDAFAAAYRAFLTEMQNAL